ncbi:MAG: DNA-processing protein DprA [Mogibacterium sp.]|nr:DNA-processing protein DprA [Mogibacterium sp.]
MRSTDLLSKIQKIDIQSSEFPAKLREIPHPPEQIYCVGDTSLLHCQSVSVVGSRKFTVYGKTVAMMIGRRLGECGIPVVSGLAYGIDAFAHEGVLDAGGRTIGVLASGILRMGPKRNLDLMFKELEQGGLILSENPPDYSPQKYDFPLRNRIISGLGDSVVVVEANFNSGALITAQHATEQGRPVYAVPGNINSQFSMGSNLLIRDGACPVVIIDDLIRDLGITPPDNADKADSLGADEKRVYDAVSRYNGVSADVIAAELDMSTGWVNAMVTVMEIKGLVQTYSGKIYLAK